MKLVREVPVLRISVAGIYVGDNSGSLKMLKVGAGESSLISRKLGERKT